MDGTEMTLSEAFALCDAMEEAATNGQVEFEEILIEKKTQEHIVTGSGPVVEIPSLGVKMIEVTWLDYDSDWDDYMPDWCGTAVFEDDELALIEQDPRAVAFHNFYRCLTGGTADFDAIMAKVLPKFEIYPEAEPKEFVA